MFCALLEVEVISDLTRRVLNSVWVVVEAITEEAEAGERELHYYH